MLDQGVVVSTFENVAILLLFIAVGFVLRRAKVLPDSTAKVLSKMCTMVFTPAYTFRSLAANFTVDTVLHKTLLLALGLGVILAVVLMANLLGRAMGRTELEKKSLIYAYSIPNYGYFGYPAVAGVFGEVIKTEMIVFCIPTTIVTYTYGYLLFSKDQKLSWKRVVLNPMVISVVLGSAIGLSGWKMPGLLDDALGRAAGCMSPVSMVLAGFVLGARPIKELVSGWRSYLYSAIRLLGIPVVFGGVLFLLGLRDVYLLLPLVVLSMPLGLNLVVFPESYGYDSRDNARMCFVSYLLALAVLPFSFAFINYISFL